MFKKLLILLKRADKKLDDTIKILAATQNWRKVYDFLNLQLKNSKVSHSDASRILLASEEIFVNISNYAYEEKKGNVIINFVCSNSSPVVVEIKFTDEGVKFDPTKVKMPDVNLDLNQRKIGGLGLFIVNKVMNKVEYKYENSSNNLIITKIIK